MSAAGPAPAPALSDAAAVHRAPRGRLRLAHQMSQVTTYTCDRCRKASTSPSALPLFRVHLEINVPSNVRSDYRVRPKQAEWCSACMDAIGLVEIARGKNGVPEPDQPVPSFEDLIRKIVRSELPQ